jgi:resuscitation-promoting factor RpfB
MRLTNTVVLAIGGMLALGACGSQSTTSSAGTPAASAAPSSAPSITAEDTPVPKKRMVTETRAIPFTTRRVNDATLARGTTKVRVHGRTGVKTLTYEMTLVNGQQTGKRLVRVVVKRAPVTRVIAVGTRSTRQCDPNYSGACVPIASDVDCAGGSGNGPAYVQGPVRVVGTDIYDLDRDGDGTACDG